MRRAGTRISSRRSRVMVARPRPFPRSMPVTSCSHADIAQASRADHIHTVLRAGSPEGRCRSAAPILASLFSASMSVRWRYQCSVSASASGWSRPGWSG
jgi:hypothetical protein